MNEKKGLHVMREEHILPEDPIVCNLKNWNTIFILIDACSK